MTRKNRYDNTNANAGDGQPKEGQRAQLTATEPNEKPVRAAKPKTIPCSGKARRSAKTLGRLRGSRVPKPKAGPKTTKKQY